MQDDWKGESKLRGIKASRFEVNAFNASKLRKAKLDKNPRLVRCYSCGLRFDCDKFKECPNCRVK